MIQLYQKDTIRIACIAGTRPEAIKMAPVINELKRRVWADVRVIATGQHNELADDVFDLFSISPEINLRLMRAEQSLTELTSKALLEIEKNILNIKPRIVLAQGDTTSVMATAISCFYNRIPFHHIEAGLRSFNIKDPFPEEFNRIVASRLASAHYTPTDKQRDLLINEGVPPENIIVTGNTVIDALLQIATRKNKYKLLAKEYRQPTMPVLITVHRRESFGEPLIRICRAIESLAERNQNVDFFWPVHPNPQIKNIIHDFFEGNTRINLLPPLGYQDFISVMNQSYLILSDSGGVQEEAPALKKPVLVLRNETERHEAIEARATKLVGTMTENIIAETERLLTDKDSYLNMTKGSSPYGDGMASIRIANHIEHLIKA